MQLANFKSQPCLEENLSTFPKMPLAFCNIAGKLRLATQGIQKILWHIKQSDTPKYSPFKKIFKCNIKGIEFSN